MGQGRPAKRARPLDDDLHEAVAASGDRGRRRASRTQILHVHDFGRDRRENPRLADTASGHRTKAGLFAKARHRRDGEGRMAAGPSVNWKTGRHRPATAPRTKAARASGKERKRSRGPRRDVCVTAEMRADLERIHQALRQTRSWIDELEQAVVIFLRGVLLTKR